MIVEGASDASVRLRPIRWPEDRPFLEEVYASTRTDELAQVPWSDDQKTAFCRMQFAAQHGHYQEHYPHAAFQVIELQGKPIGRLYVHRGEREIRIIDITLLPDHRRSGLGTRLLQELQSEAQTSGRPLTIHVEKFNPALRLYERLGFRIAADRGAYLFLQWTATT